MSSTSTIEDLFATDVASLPLVAQSEWVLAADRVMSQLKAKHLEGLGVWERAGAFGVDGAMTGAAWLIHRGDVTPVEARRSMADTRLLAEHPRSAAACATLGITKVLTMLRPLTKRVLEAYVEQEEILLEAVEPLTVERTAELMAAWVREMDDSGNEPHAPRKSEVRLSATFEGLWHLSGLLDPETGAALCAALEQRIAIIRRAQRDAQDDDKLNTPELRGEALAALVSDATAADPASGVAARPSFRGVIDLDTIEGRVGQAAIDRAGPIRGETARRLACDAQVTRIITGPKSEPFDVGRLARTVTRKQRDVIVQRDRHCTFPGCRMPGGWCDAHHIRFWGKHLGRTDCRNLTLLCRKHHTLLHEGKWVMERLANGDLRVTRPDGTILDPDPRPHAPPGDPPPHQRRQRRRPNRHQAPLFA